jgi:hypothetical protein
MRSLSLDYNHGLVEKVLAMALECKSNSIKKEIVKKKHFHQRNLSTNYQQFWSDDFPSYQ